MVVREHVECGDETSDRCDVSIEVQCRADDNRSIAVTFPLVPPDCHWVMRHTASHNQCERHSSSLPAVRIAAAVLPELPFHYHAAAEASMAAVSLAADAATVAIDETQEDEERVALYQHARSAVPALVIIDRINKQTNIGGIVRSASALGVNHICFLGPVRIVSRRSHVDQHSNKPARVRYQHMTAAQLNNCFRDQAIRSARRHPC